MKKTQRAKSKKLLNSGISIKEDSKNIKYINLQLVHFLSLLIFLHCAGSSIYIKGDKPNLIEKF